MVGAACALYAARPGLTVTVLDRGSVGGGTTGTGEGNLLVSDKAPGPELTLALRSQELWRALADEDFAVVGVGGVGRGGHGPRDERPGRFGARFEYEAKGGLVVASQAADLAVLAEFAAAQRAAGVIAEAVASDDLCSLEPEIAAGLAGGFFYPEDAQVMPTLAAAYLLRASGAKLRIGVAVIGLMISGGVVRGVRTPLGEISSRFVVNAAGFQGPAIAEMAGSTLPIQPRRGFVLVTEPLPPLIRHKVYTATY